jgi:hypothetical protein
MVPTAALSAKVARVSVERSDHKRQRGAFSSDSRVSGGIHGGDESMTACVDLRRGKMVPCHRHHVSSRQWLRGWWRESVE